MKKTASVATLLLSMATVTSSWAQLAGTTASPPRLPTSAPCHYPLSVSTAPTGTWGQPIDSAKRDEYSPIAAEVNPRTHDVTFRFKASLPITVNPDKPVPTPEETGHRPQNLVKHLHKVSRVYVRECVS